jgi:DNA polymerase-3 subunit delta'
LFIGPRGCGKELVARTLAQALNCLTKEHEACDECDSCRRIAEGVHPDVYWVRPESKSRRIQVDQIREFENAVNLKPSLARIKVGVIVDADCLGDEASNAFLKTLEEPPAQTVILLLTGEPQRLLPTIISRCLRITFGPTTPLAESPYRAKLAEVLTGRAAGQAKVDSRIVGAYQLLGEITGILQQMKQEIRSRVEAEVNLDRYGELELKAREKLEQQMEARIEGEYRAAREQVLEELYTWFRDILLCVEGADEHLLEHTGAVAGQHRIAGELTHQQALANLEAVEQIREALFRNIAEPLAIEVGLLTIAANSRPQSPVAATAQ